MRSYLVTLLILGSSPFAAGADSAPSGVEAIAEAQVSKPARFADIHASFRTTAPSQRDAREAMREQTHDLLERLRSQVGDSVTIQARDLSVTPQLERDDGKTRQVGYHVTRHIDIQDVAVLELANYTAMLGDATPYRLDLANYRLTRHAGSTLHNQKAREDDAKPIKEQALAKATRKARSKARAMAGESDRQLGRLHRVEQIETRSAHPRTLRTQSDSAANEGDVMDLEAGNVSVTAKVRAHFAWE